MPELTTKQRPRELVVDDLVRGLDLDDVVAAEKAIDAGRLVARDVGVLPPREQLARHRRHVEEWILNLKRLAALYAAIKAGRVAVRFDADPHQTNPDLMQKFDLGLGTGEGVRS
jgi:hypothetical protein